MTVAEFALLPEAARRLRLELHRGEIFESAWGRKIHTSAQHRIANLIRDRIDEKCLGVDMEFPFRPEPEYQVWIADVAVYHLAEWHHTADDDWYRGVPAIVIEVLSPSNTASEMLARERICLRNGGQEFWLVDTDRECVRVVRAGGESTDYDIDGTLTSACFSTSISVREIFAL